MAGRPDGRTEKLGIEPAQPSLDWGLGWAWQYFWGSCKFWKYLKNDVELFCDKLVTLFQNGCFYTNTLILTLFEIFWRLFCPKRALFWVRVRSKNCFGVYWCSVTAFLFSGLLYWVEKKLFRVGGWSGGRIKWKYNHLSPQLSWGWGLGWAWQ